MEENKSAARLGKMRSAYQARNFDDAIAAARDLISNSPSPAEQREGWFTEAWSLLATSHRDEAYLFFRKLAEQQPSTPEGAESYYMVVRDLCDSGEFAKLTAPRHCLRLSNPLVVLSVAAKALTLNELE